MDGLQRQVIKLNHKVEQLHEIVERLSSQLTTLTAQQDLENYSDHSEMPSSLNHSGSFSQGRFQAVMEHKDVLIDDTDGQHGITSSNEHNLSAEIQIRRLTTQLTAAYNRIAVLEEQLLASRVHF